MGKRLPCPLGDEPQLWNRLISVPKFCAGDEWLCCHLGFLCLPSTWCGRKHKETDPTGSRSCSLCEDSRSIEGKSMGMGQFEATWQMVDISLLGTSLCFVFKQSVGVVPKTHGTFYERRRKGNNFQIIVAPQGLSVHERNSCAGWKSSATKRHHEKGYSTVCKITRGRVWLDRKGPFINFFTVRMRASKKLFRWQDQNKPQGSDSAPRQIIRLGSCLVQDVANA